MDFGALGIAWPLDDSSGQACFLARVGQLDELPGEGEPEPGAHLPELIPEGR